MHKSILGLLAITITLLTMLFGAESATAQPSLNDVNVATVDRAPFSMDSSQARTGFSIELWNAVAEDLRLTTRYIVHDQFSGMLDQVKAGQVDVAVANISVTSEREEELDFSHAIFESGLQIMVPQGQSIGTYQLVFSALLETDLLISIGVAFVLLMGGGMLMWVFEHKKQPYFDRAPAEAIFPSFWWALNLVVNGGFEERVPRSFFGRIFAVFLVLSSLFIVSIFVAKITAVLTVDAIQGSISSLNDLYGKRVATIENSTSAQYLETREHVVQTYPGLDELFEAFENGEIEAVVFDAPILAYYTIGRGKDHGMLVGTTFRRESYAFAFPAGSEYLEGVNQELLTLRENGTYDVLYRKYFGQLPN